MALKAYHVLLYRASVLSFLNVMVIATQPSGLGLLIALPIRVIHSVVACRITLRIRQPGAREPGGAFMQESRPPLSALVFGGSGGCDNNGGEVLL
ncbi:hypothetical protein BJ138DRAFT_1167515 [Hygrophoropsis aurantiaca]|uniref:Uncharacterized protein n=1 Tax=Hygrophoropsis aurantiaca TaxID=72124 RepID=A0ACB7ZT31_9AGAM|nr:hypothetical protein BJ138DRAFT_1167515 [Hygrophoropsis aurantiaca]